MKTLAHHIKTVKAQPHHIRKQVAFATAFVAVAAVGVIWAGVSLATGAFAIQGSSFAESTGANGAVATAPTTDAALLASPAAANDASQPAQIEVVDAPPAVTPAAAPTTIPF